MLHSLSLSVSLALDLFLFVLLLSLYLNATVCSALFAVGSIPSGGTSARRRRRLARHRQLHPAAAPHQSELDPRTPQRYSVLLT